MDESKVRVQITNTDGSLAWATVSIPAERGEPTRHTTVVAYHDELTVLELNALALVNLKDRLTHQLSEIDREIEDMRRRRKQRD